MIHCCETLATTPARGKPAYLVERLLGRVGESEGRRGDALEDVVVVLCGAKDGWTGVRDIPGSKGLDGNWARGAWARAHVTWRSTAHAHGRVLKSYQAASTSRARRKRMRACRI